MKLLAAFRRGKKKKQSVSILLESHIGPIQNRTKGPDLDTAGRLTPSLRTHCDTAHGKSSRMSISYADVQVG